MIRTITPILFAAAIALPLNATAQEAQPADAEVVLNDYVDAVGGRAAIERIENRVTRGRMQLAELAAEISLYQRTPDHYRMVQVFPFGEMDQGYDGEQAWRTIPGQGRVPIVGEELEDQKFQFSLRQPLMIADVYSMPEEAEIRTIDGRSMHVLTFTSLTGSPQEWFFDAETHLLARVEAEVQGPNGIVSVETSYGDWKDVDGVLIPHEMRTRFDDVDVRLEFTSVEHNQELNDDVFAPSEQQP